MTDVLEERVEVRCKRVDRLQQRRRFGEENVGCRQPLLRSADRWAKTDEQIVERRCSLFKRGGRRRELFGDRLELGNQRVCRVGKDDKSIERLARFALERGQRNEGIGELLICRGSS